jgi:hypothetical protein
MQGENYVSMDVGEPFLKEAFIIFDPKSFPKLKAVPTCPHCGKPL